VKIDGNSIVTLTPGQIGVGGDFNRFQSFAVFLGTGAHPLAFEGVQNGPDSDTIIDDLSLTGTPRATLPVTTELHLTGPTAVFEPGPGTSTLNSLAGVSGSRLILNASDLIITANNSDAVFAGTITGTGSLTNYGTLRLVGNGSLDFSGTFINHGVLDLMTWNGTLPAGFINDGIVLDRSLVRVRTFTNVGDKFLLSIDGYTGHNYQLQRRDALDSDWQNVGVPIPGDNASILFSNPAGTPADRCFYRISVRP
jgi:hypothetical protein